MKANKYLAVALAATMLTSGAAVGASAVNNTEQETYVLMNIPYAEFYQADLNNEVKVDAYTSATKSKPRAGSLSAGSYHKDSSGDEITGVTFPVKLVGNVDLSAYKQVFDSDSLEITVKLRGRENTASYNGKETLFESDSYSYYVLDSKPEFYKELTQNADGSFSFGETKGKSEEVSAEVELTKDSRYGDYQMNITSDALTSTEEKPITVYGVVLSTKEGNDYGLRHMENIWRNTALAWCTGYTTNVHGCPTSSEHYEQMVGQTIEEVTYYTSDGIKTINGLNLYVAPEKYALMNIPYSAFYDSEVENDIPVDIYTSATKQKTRTGSLAGGSYHVTEDGSEITGIVYPVKLGDIDLSKYHRVTDSDSYETTVTNRGKTTTTVYNGKDALFGSESYSYYVLDEMPSYYKTVSDNGDGTLSFSKDNTPVKEIKAEAELTTESNYGDYQLNITSDELKGTDENPITVYGVVLETEEGDSYGLRHMENIWRNTDLAWCTGFTANVHGCPTSSEHYKKMMGQTINKVIYFTNEGKKSFETDLYVPIKTGAALKVENTAVANGKTTFSTEQFAEDFDYQYTLTNDSDESVKITVSDKTVHYPTDIANGRYTLTVSDKNGKYASVVSKFELTVSAPAQFNGNIFSENPALVALDGTDETTFKSYLESIAQVTVNDNTYNAVGRGSVQLIDTETGLIDISNTDVFAEGTDEFTILVQATGYDAVTFTLSRTQSKTDEPSEPSDEPSDEPKDEPTVEPSDEPSDKPTDDPSEEPSDEPTVEPSDDSNDEPTVQPTENSTDDNELNNNVVFKETGVDVPKTADATTVGGVIALLAASVGAMFMLKRKKEND